MPKLYLLFGISTNITILAYFKYMDFFITNVNYIIGTNFSLMGLLLPLAISFFTFQQIAYLVDSYRTKQNEQNLTNYALFITFFPQLIAGPIVHHSQMMPQFKSIPSKNVNYFLASQGLFIFAIGLFKKTVIADSLAIYANNGFALPQDLNMIEAWTTSFAYTFQLYFDFSGYSDMAIGLALLFGIKLPINFLSPYKALSIQDFWQRWHITLSQFLRDYIYIPLGGNRSGSFRLYSNLFIVFLIGGIWHGAGWTFVIWGALHGGAMIIHRFWSTFVPFTLPKPLAWLTTFAFINITWVFFRASSLEDALILIDMMFNLDTLVLPQALLLIFPDTLFPYQFVPFVTLFNTLQGGFEVTLWILLSFYLVLFTKSSSELGKHFQPNIRYLVGITLLLFLGMMHMNRASPFLYFNF